MTRLAAGQVGRAAAATLALALAAHACVTVPPPEPEAPPPAAVERGPRRQFQFETLDGKELSHETVAGRVTVIGFATTYDLASQVQARVLGDLARTHAPRLNVALLVLEAPDNRPLVEAFVSSMSLAYPVALADAATIAGTGPFAGLHHVPSVIVLDRQGHEVFRHLGLIEQPSLEEAVRQVERLDAQGKRSRGASP